MQVMNQFHMIGIIFKESCYQKDKAEKNYFRSKPRENVHRLKNNNNSSSEKQILKAKNNQFKTKLQRGSSQFRHTGEIKSPRTRARSGNWFIL